MKHTVEDMQNVECDLRYAIKRFHCDFTTSKKV